jgi:carbon monoxide dehydrogenase subunit G
MIAGGGAGRKGWVVAFRLDRRFEFAVPAAALWDRLTRIDDFPAWWPWLRSIEGDGFVTGGRTHVAVTAPVPWVLRLALEVTDLDHGASIAVDVSGDLTGTASLAVEATPTGASARLRWTVTPSSPTLRVAARATQPLVVFGQNWVVNAGLRQARSAIEGRPRR